MLRPERLVLVGEPFARWAESVQVPVDLELEWSFHPGMALVASGGSTFILASLGQQLQREFRSQTEQSEPQIGMRARVGVLFRL